MICYVKELPEHIKLSDHLKGIADGYIVVQVYGKSHYIPLTKEMKKQFNIHRKNNRVDFDNFQDECRFEEMVRVIADSLYLQTRDTVGTEIREEVVSIVQDKIADLLAPIAQKEIDLRFEAKDKLLGDGNNEKP